MSGMMNQNDQQRRRLLMQAQAQARQQQIAGMGGGNAMNGISSTGQDVSGSSMNVTAPMVPFGNPGTTSLDAFHFNPNSANMNMMDGNMMMGNGNMSGSMNDNLSTLNSQFAGMMPPFDINTGMSFSGGVDPSNALDFAMSGPYMNMGLDFSTGNMHPGQFSNAPSYASSPVQSTFMEQAIQQNEVNSGGDGMTHNIPQDYANNQSDTLQQQHQRQQQQQHKQQQQQRQQLQQQQQRQLQQLQLQQQQQQQRAARQDTQEQPDSSNSTPSAKSMSKSTSQSRQQHQPISQPAVGTDTFNAQQQDSINAGMAPTSGQNETSQALVPSLPYSLSDMTTLERPGFAQPSETIKYPTNAYSSSGFDMLRILTAIATRPNPEINIGAVDMSCAFVVCDINQYDLPIVYCSDVFERLTGYTRHEILGQNCRFLQAPDGAVQAGKKRHYTDDDTVRHLKNKIALREEVQVNIINYRKDGQPFMNLLTMIPIRWDTDEYRYYIGFQVDLVEQPGSVTSRNKDGSYTINYQRGPLPRYVVKPPKAIKPTETGKTISADDVSTVLTSIGQGDSDLSQRMFDKILLENTDDVVHVLSLKGLFLYLSPAAKQVLEYDASELVGTALSSICHPSDIVPVTRELKEASQGGTVNVVFRVRRKKSGYTWFESHGSLHTEQGKGRKCIILVGRERPVYALPRSEIVNTEVPGENELWSKMSTAGMFLFVSSNVRTLLDRLPEELVGTSIQALMRPNSKEELGKILGIARTGKTCTLRHEVLNKRGQTLQAQTTLYSGDAPEGTKPTFLIAQTRLLKMTRAMVLQSQKMTSPRTEHGGSNASPAQSGTGTQTAPASFSRQSASSTPSRLSISNSSPVPYATTHHGGQGLLIGHQDEVLAAEDNLFDELKTTRSSSWQFELRQLEKQNRLLLDELTQLISRRKKRKRRKGGGALEKDCANCHTRTTPEWRRGPSGQRDLCNSCGLRWAKQNGRVSPRKTSDAHSNKSDASPALSNDRITGAAKSTQLSTVASAGSSVSSKNPAANAPGLQPSTSSEVTPAGTIGTGTGSSATPASLAKSTLNPGLKDSGANTPIPPNSDTTVAARQQQLIRDHTDHSDRDFHVSKAARTSLPGNAAAFVTSMPTRIEETDESETENATKKGNTNTQDDDLDMSGMVDFDADADADADQEYDSTEQRRSDDSGAGEGGTGSGSGMADSAAGVGIGIGNEPGGGIGVG